MNATLPIAGPRYSVGDELASSVIHGIGIVLSIAGLAILVAFAARHGDARVIAASAVYGTTLLIAGGLAYTLGVPFYLWRKLPYHHSLWHLCVLTGSVLHFLAVLLYVIPDPA